ncbi:TRZ/ATZ family hydrolase [Halieaceae bacterium IMCC14734]|uniref:5-methylthioadenosine/S-adenosylhomocysteine deaminase n=1 Tax=Candidatus Litorirhabdus singularis TaxID=2518993 RepID=A0ABT3TG39_9GAMM|nr:TRZ/ATZ family hydrolase [Candidatus Litorirhabdus singularis]MCX2981165.1 TRZ/ATZ family hydrolase [Candidatus Litorirhabdus singularis]
MEIADTLIFAGWIVPVLPEGQVLENHAVVISNGRISAVLPASEARKITAAETVELPDHTLMPGLINCHGHAAMSLLRGFADDLPLQPWLENHIWPTESEHVGPEFVRDGVNLALAEMLRSGTTCFSDMYFFPDVTANCCVEAGMRSQLSFPVFDFPSAWGKDADDYISKGLALRDDYKHSELISVVFGPHAPYTVAESALQSISTLSAELDLPVHIHLHETRQEVNDALAVTGQRPLHNLNELGLIGPRTQCVHMTELSTEDITLLAAAGAHVVHCPSSNMKLASGICPVTALHEAGVNVALGTDSAASNNRLDLMTEMRSAALLAKTESGDAAALPAAKALRMATLDGATALGKQDELGTLEIGKYADLIAIDLNTPETQPVHNVISQLVYAVSSSQVTHSWVNGQCLMSERQLQTLNLNTIKSNAAKWRHRIAGAENHD